MVFMSVLAACGGWKRVGTEDAKAPAQGFTALLNQQALFQKLGRLSAGDPLPFTGSVAQVKGAGDTVLVILGLSLENRALSFQKDNNAYVARYRVDAVVPAGDRPAGERRRRKRRCGWTPSRKPGAPTRACCSRSSSGCCPAPTS